MSKPYIPPSSDDFEDLPLDFTKSTIDSDLADLTTMANWKNYYSKTEVKPPLHFELEGKSVTVYGGSCHTPTVEDADVYISLDEGPPVYYWEQPWYEDEGKKHIRLPIQDMSIPDDTDDFKSCVSYIQFYLTKGKKVHIGCIGGHGRTGMVLTALIQKSMGDKLVDDAGNKISAIDYVRKNYAQKAVETIPQILFLHYACGVDFPKRESEDIKKFLAFFKKEVGASLADIMKDGAEFDDIADMVREVDHMMFSQMKFARGPVGKVDFLTPPHMQNLDILRDEFKDTGSSNTGSSSNPFRNKF